MEYGFYSYKLNKPFKTLEELNAAEEAMAIKERKELKIKEEREKAAKEIEELIKQREQLSEKINAKINDFIDKYKTYHWTFRSTYDPMKHVTNSFFKFL